ncbi:MAG: protein kinase [Deltaproteobacteria bacterium]|nr:protein kinase [Deltaproteobacteria bacterium]
MTRDQDNDGLITLPSGGPPDPKQIGSARIEARIAVGPYSRIYRAVDLERGRTVVVKVLAAETDTEVAGRFLDAAQRLTGLVDPHVVEVLGSGMEGTTPWVMLEYLDGTDLDAGSRRELTMIPATAIRVVLDAAAGLHAALARGVLPGDVRPRHLLRHHGVTKVTGFGLSPPFQTAQGRRLRGHPAYVAPEVAQGAKPTAQSDLYSLGATLFELVVGRPPFGAAGNDALVACAVHEPPPTFAGVGVEVPEPLEELLSRLIAKAPERRFADPAALLLAGTAMLPALRRLVLTDPAVVVEDGRQLGLRLPLPEGDTLLGRVPGEGLAIDDARVSRRHAIIHRRGDELEVEDLGSRNGIRVNGVAARTHKLCPGDRIAIGDTVLRIDGDRPPPTVELPAAVPASPVRGAFGDVEIAHGPAQQAGAAALSMPGGASTAARLHILGRLAPLLASRPSARLLELKAEVLGVLGAALGADQSAFVRVDRGQPVFEARSGNEAKVLSCVLPALERALPGQMALVSSVRVGQDDRWGVMLAPVTEGGVVAAYLVLVRHQSSFDDAALSTLEGACALLSLRSPTLPPRE